MTKSQGSSSNVKVLLVDDRPANLLALKASLEGLHLDLVEAHSGEAALRRLHDEEFAVVLLDVQMPGLDGFETARRIRAREETRHTPIILQSAYDSDRATIETAYGLGAVDFLIKPLMPVALRAKVQAFVELFQHKEQNRRQAEQLRQAERRGFEQQLSDENRRLQEERERLRVTLASIGDGVITTDPEGRVTFLNPIAESLTGWTNDDAVGRPLETVFRIVNEMTRQAVENPVTKVVATGRIVGLANHTVLLARNGTERAIDDSAAPIHDTNRRLAGVVLVFRDVTERRQAERTASFLASIVESSEDGIIGKDIDGIITSWNLSAERMFGYSAAEAIGHAISMLAPPGSADEMPAILERIRRGERVEHFDTLRRAKDGRLVPISLSVSPIKDEEGNIVGASKIVRDISDRKQAEEALHGEKERLQATLTGIGDAVIVTDARGFVTLINPVAQKLTGWGEEAVGRPLDEVFRIVNEWTHQPAESPVGRVMREGAIVGLANHTALVAKDGAVRPIEDSAAPVRNIAGEVTGVVMVFRDASERRVQEATVQRHQEILQRQSERLREVAAASSMFNSATSTDSLLQVATDEARRIIGAHQCVSSLTVNEQWAQAINARSLSDKYAQWRSYDAKPDGTGIYAVVCRGNKPLRLTQAELETHAGFRGFGGEAGNHPPLRGWLAVPFVGRDGRNLGLIQLSDKLDGGEFTADDEAILAQLATITSVAIENARLYDGLRESDHRKNEFLAMLAHELRNPLAPVRNAVQILQLKGPPIPELQWARDVIDRQVHQMTRLVDDLMDVSRISRGKIELKREQIGLAEVVARAVETSRPLIDERGHEFVVTLPPQPIYVDADPTRLSQVLANLLNNAAKYTERGGRIDLTALAQGNEVAVSIKDSGIGIPRDKLPSVFEMFSQLQPAVERSQGGLGIGLSLTKRLVEMHGGTVEARSEGPTKGSEFIVRLPAALQEASAPATADPGILVRPPTSLRVLVVDDNRDSAESWAMMLRLMGNEVCTGYDGEEAVRAAGEFQPHVALLDIGLPKIDGYDACRRIRQQPWGKSMILIAVTGWGQDDDKRKAEEAGFDRHVVKPFAPTSLMQLLAAISPAAGPKSPV